MKTPAHIQELFVEEALRQLADQEAKGYGLNDAGKNADGAPMRVTPSYILDNVKWKLEGQGLTLRGATIRDVEDALSSAGFKEEYKARKRFFSL